MADAIMPSLPPGSVDFTLLHNELIKAGKKDGDVDLAALVEKAVHKESSPEMEAATPILAPAPAPVAKKDD